MAHTPGHVFVVRGDLTAIACDWWLLPTGTAADGRPGDVQPHWRTDRRVRGLVDRPGWPAEAPSSARRAVMAAEPGEERGIIAVHTGEDATEPAAWFAEALTAAVGVAQAHGGRHLRDRPVPLIGFPLLGTLGGGAGDRRATVLEALLETASRLAGDGVDLVLVLTSAQAYSAAQRLRLSPGPQAVWGATLDTDEMALAGRLARQARAGKLVAFLGAGLSAAAGLPLWPALLEELGEQADVSQDDQSELLSMDPRDAARVLQDRLGGQEHLDSALRERFSAADRASLAHALVASLPIREAATTNYDRLFETAWGAAVYGPGPDAPRRVAVLPRDDASDATHWLLKLHGDVDDQRSPLVLSRDEYLRFEQSGGAIAGVLQAILLTRHLLIVGYGLQDETFHRIAHEVRDVGRSPARAALTGAGEPARQLGTALLVSPPRLFHEVWRHDLHMADLSRGQDERGVAARRQDVLLDLAGALAAPVESYVLGAGWEALSDHGPDERLRAALLALEQVPGLGEPLARTVEEVLRKFGRDAGS